MKDVAMHDRPREKLERLGAHGQSKSVLRLATHIVSDLLPGVAYFPAYELVIDVLRDYRFYDIDLVHPNYPATEFVLEKFEQTFMSTETIALTEEIKKIVIARKHRSANPQTEAHKKFLENHLQKTKELQQKFPFLPLQKEIEYFSGKVNATDLREAPNF